MDRVTGIFRGLQLQPTSLSQSYQAPSISTVLQTVTEDVNMFNVASLSFDDLNISVEQKQNIRKDMKDIKQRVENAKRNPETLDENRDMHPRFAKILKQFHLRDSTAAVQRSMQHSNIDDAEGAVEHKDTADDVDVHNVDDDGIDVPETAADADSTNVTETPARKSKKKQSAPEIPSFDMYIGSEHVARVVHTKEKKLDLPNLTVFPDFALVAPRFADTTTSHCKVLVEITRSTHSLDSDHLNRLKKYHAVLLDANPNRVSAVSVLTNLVDMLFFKSTRDAGREGLIHVRSSSLTFDTGLVALVNLLGNNGLSGYADPIYTYTSGGNLHLLRRIGAGVSCKVFEAKLVQQSVVIVQQSVVTKVVAKIFDSQDLFDVEREVWRNLNGKRSVYLCEMMGCCTEAADGTSALILVYRPVLLHIAREDLLPFTRQLFDALQNFSEIGLIHRDITSRHLMQHPKTGKLMICDLGFALVLEENAQPTRVKFAGSNEFAPTHVLRVQKSAKSASVYYTPTMRDDVESALKMILCVIRPDLEHKLKQLLKDNKFGAFADLWNTIENRSPLWKSAFEMARDKDTPIRKVWEAVAALICMPTN